MLALANADLRRRFCSDIMAIDIHVGAGWIAFDDQHGSQLREVNDGRSSRAGGYGHRTRLACVSRFADDNGVLPGLEIG